MLKPQVSCISQEVLKFCQVFTTVELTKLIVEVFTFYEIVFQSIKLEKKTSKKLCKHDDLKNKQQTDKKV